MAGEMQNDLKELKKKNQILEDKLTSTNTLLHQFVDKANQPMLNALPTPANHTVNTDDITKLTSPNQLAVISNGHLSNQQWELDSLWHCSILLLYSTGS